MRHLRKGKKLGRVSRQRKALLRSLAVALVRDGKIRTTLPKAKALRPYIEKVITKARRGGMAIIRELRKDFDGKSVNDLLKKWGPLFQKRKGGYTRITETMPRVSDASPMAYIEFVEMPADVAKAGGAKQKKKEEKKEIIDKDRKEGKE